MEINYYNELSNLVLYNGSSFLIIYSIDQVILYYNKKGRWFQLHFYINMLISLLTFSDVLDCFKNPIYSYEKNSYFISMCFALCLHIYHILYFNLTIMDIYHHIFSCFVCTPLAAIYQKKGISCYLFFNTGLPGGIDYLLLSLVKNNYISSLKEKKINSYLNTYIRMPGGVVTSYLVFKDVVNYSNILATIGMYIFSFLIFFNSCFFCKLANENYVERKYDLMKKLNKT
jgi:hypothetical protein